MTNHINTDSDLIDVLLSADESDLAILADFITDNNKGRISLDSGIKGQLDTFKRLETLKDNTDLIVKEIQEFGGNSFVNFVRGTGVPYRELLEDVARHMSVKYESTDSVESIELKILLMMATKAMEKMTPDEQRDFVSKVSGGKVTGLGPAAMLALQAAILAGGFSSYMLATVIAQHIAKQLVGRGLGFAATGGLMRSISAFAGPIGWALTAIWTAFDLSSPAYRVTVPCVLQVAYMRQKLKVGELPKCKQCGEMLLQGQKFCAECGAAVESEDGTA